jgi:hypothetical protein
MTTIALEFQKKWETTKVKLVVVQRKRAIGRGAQVLSQLTTSYKLKHLKTNPPIGNPPNNPLIDTMIAKLKEQLL